MSEHSCGMQDPVPVGKGRDVEIIPDLIAPDHQVALDAQGLIWSRYPEHVSGRQRHLRDFQRLIPDELADSGFDIAQLAQDELSAERTVVPASATDRKGVV